MVSKHIKFFVWDDKLTKKSNSTILLKKNNFHVHTNVWDFPSDTFICPKWNLPRGGHGKHSDSENMHDKPRVGAKSILLFMTMDKNHNLVR